MYLFFQAEDGIRDGHVTGVQTCALPISEAYFADETTDTAMKNEEEDSFQFDIKQAKIEEAMPEDEPLITEDTPTLSRSEERRVGKECRYSRSEYLYKNKKLE